MVGRMLEFRKNMQGVLQHSFAGHVEFAQALKEGESAVHALVGRAELGWAQHSFAGHAELAQASFGRQTARCPCWGERVGSVQV